jgi:hypothetical protein
LTKKLAFFSKSNVMNKIFAKTRSRSDWLKHTKATKKDCPWGFEVKNGPLLMYLSERSLSEDHEEVEVGGPDQIFSLHVVRDQRVLLRRRPRLVLWRALQERILSTEALFKVYLRNPTDCVVQHNFHR